MAEIILVEKINLVEKIFEKIILTQYKHKSVEHKA